MFVTKHKLPEDFLSKFIQLNAGLAINGHLKVKWAFTSESHNLAWWMLFPLHLCGATVTSRGKGVWSQVNYFIKIFYILSYLKCISHLNKLFLVQCTVFTWRQTKDSANFHKCMTFVVFLMNAAYLFSLCPNKLTASQFPNYDMCDAEVSMHQSFPLLALWKDSTG